MLLSAQLANKEVKWQLGPLSERNSPKLLAWECVMACLLDESQSFFFSSLSKHFSCLLFVQEKVIHNAFLIDFLDGGDIFTLNVVMAQSTCCSSGVDEIHVKSLQMDAKL